MTEKIDLFLYNGFTPRRRSPGDVFLDNGMGILRAYLKKENINFVIEDKIAMDGYGDFNLPESTRLLRDLFDKIIYGKESRIKKIYYKLRVRNLHSRFIKFQEERMDEYLDKLTQRIANDSPPVVGMKVWFGTTFTYCKRLCEMIHKASPETVVVVGGPQANVYFADGIILKYTPFDLAVYSEGEEALVKIVKIAKEYKTRRERLEVIINADIPNLLYRTPEGIKINPCLPSNVNEKLIPDYDDFSGKVMSHTIIDGLGCDYGRCYFCIHPKINPKFRLRDPNLIVDEIEYMLRQGIGFFTFTASDTPLPHAKRISEEILKRKLNLEFTMLARGSRGANTRKDYLIDAYRTIIRAGMRILYMGVECGNDDVLKEVLNKNLTTQDIIDTVKCIREASELEKKHVYIITSYIYPIPLTKNLIDKGITMESVLKDNLRMGELTKPDSFQVMPATVYPGVAWYDEPERFNISLDKEKYAATMLEFETSAHAIFDKPAAMPFTMFGMKMNDWIKMYLSMCRAANRAGLTTELNDEHIVIGRSTGYQTQEELDELSRNLFLDIISCNDEKSHELFKQTNVKSREIAESNNFN